MSLTLREKEVLNLIASGLNNPEIANRLGITKDTVKIHVSAILKKLKVKNRVQAVLLAVRDGII